MLSVSINIFRRKNHVHPSVSLSRHRRHRRRFVIVGLCARRCANQRTAASSVPTTGRATCRSRRAATSPGRCRPSISRRPLPVNPAAPPPVPWPTYPPQEYPVLGQAVHRCARRSSLHLCDGCRYRVVHQDARLSAQRPTPPDRSGARRGVHQLLQARVSRSHRGRVQHQRRRRALAVQPRGHVLAQGRPAGQASGRLAAQGCHLDLRDGRVRLDGR